MLLIDVSQTLEIQSNAENQVTIPLNRQDKGLTTNICVGTIDYIKQILGGSVYTTCPLFQPAITIIC